MERKWKCHNGCKMEYVKVETKELSESDKGHCALDDLEGVNVDYYGGGDINWITILRCPVCNQVIAVKEKGGLKI